MWCKWELIHQRWRIIWNLAGESRLHYLFHHPAFIMLSVWMRNPRSYFNGSLGSFVRCNFWFIFLFYPPLFFLPLPYHLILFSYCTWIHSKLFLLLDPSPASQVSHMYNPTVIIEVDFYSPNEMFFPKLVDKKCRFDGGCQAESSDPGLWKHF